MLDIKFVRENIEAIESKIRERQISIDLSHFMQLEAERRKLLSKIEKLRNKKNVASQKIAELKHLQQNMDKDIQKMKQVSAAIKVLAVELKTVNRELANILYTLPNIPHPSVPIGKGSEDNVEVRRGGTIPDFSFIPKPHWELGEFLNILYFQKAAKITGSRFALLAGAAAQLERALINFMLDTHTHSHGYREIAPPLIVNRNALVGTGQFPHLQNDVFRIEKSDYYLLPTGEVPITNIHREEILAEDDFPLKYVTSTPCFRREAGSWGKDTRGLIRQHQFHKVELVRIARPEDSYDELDKLVRDAEHILQMLELPYRVMVLCTADLNFSATKCYDLEVWIQTQQRYREVSSCSNFEDYQARRANIRYRPFDSTKSEFVHTVNGSGLAVGRTMVAVLENYQNEDGTIRVPKVLQPYLHGVQIIGPENARDV